MQGSHGPASAHKFLPVVDQLINMHDEGTCHADIRGCNMVFPADGASAFLIDFDYSVMEIEGWAYPNNWTEEELADTKRHHTAKRGMPILKVHDVYSFGTVMALFIPVDEQQTSIWANLCAPLLELHQAAQGAEGGVLQALRSALTATQDIPLQFAREDVKKAMKGMNGTGNPVESVPAVSQAPASSNMSTSRQSPNMYTGNRNSPRRGRGSGRGQSRASSASPTLSKLVWLN